MPQRLKEEHIMSYAEARVPGGHLRDLGPWMALGQALGLAFWQALGGGE